MSTGLRKLKVVILVAGDVLAAYLALVAVLFIRYNASSYSASLDLSPHTIIADDLCGLTLDGVFGALEARLIELKRAAGSPEFCTADAPGLVTPDEPLAPEPAQPTAAPELPAGGHYHRLRDGRKVLLVSGEHENWRVTFCREGFDKTLTRLDAQEDLSKSVFEELDGLAKQHA